MCGLYYRWVYNPKWSPVLPDTPNEGKRCGKIMLRGFFNFLISILLMLPTLSFNLILTIFIDDLGMISVLILGWSIPSFFIGFLFFSGLQAKLLSMMLQKISLFRVQSQYLTQSTPLQGD